MNDPIEIPQAPKKSIQFTLLMTLGTEVIGGENFAAGIIIDSPFVKNVIVERLECLSLAFVRTLKKKNLLEDK